MGALGLLGLCAGLSTGWAVNVLVDPGFEEGGSAWSMNTWGGTSQLDSTLAHSGTNSWKFNGDQSAGAWNGGRQLNIPVQDTKFYRYSAWVKAPTASVATPLPWTFRQNVGAGGVDIGPSSITAPDWTQVFGPFVQPSAGQTTFSYVGFHDLAGTMPYYVDDLAVTETDPVVLQGQVVDGTGTGVDGATVSAASPLWTAPATTTAGGGYYTLSVPPTTYSVGARTPGYKGSTTVVVAANPTTAATIVLATDPDYDPDLIFSVRSSAYTPVAPWPTAFPAGDALTVLGAPGVQSFGGVPWEKNAYPTGDGFRLGTYSTPIPVNGVSIVAAVRPTRNGNGNTRGEVVDIMYDRVALSIGQGDGQIQVARNGWNFASTAHIADGQTTIMSLVIQADGSYVVYTNGVAALSVAAGGGGMVSLDPNVAGSYANAINVGRNNPDGWSAYNGFIGDVYVYQVALDATKRAALESSLLAKFITNATLSYTITASSGANGTISPTGAVSVLQGYDKTFTMSANSGFVVGSVLVDGVSVGAVPSYTFTNVAAPHTISASFVTLPPQTITSSVTGAGGTISPLGALGVPAGTDQTYTMTPITGYAVSNVVIDGVSQGEIYGYTFPFVIAPHTIAVSFRALDLNVPKADQLIFAAVANALPGNGTTNNWPTYVPAGQTNLIKGGSPTSVIGVGGVDITPGVGTNVWESNVHSTGDGFRFPGGTGAGGEYLAPIPCAGATIVVVAAPATGGPRDDWNSVVDVFYDRLTLGIRNDTGAVFARVNGTGANSTTLIPSGQPTVLSLVAQPDGTFKVWANEREILTGTGSALTSLVPGSDGFKHYIDIGRNDPDGWTAFNGNIGDVFLYRTALTDAEREMLQNALAAKYGIVLPVFTTLSGKVTLTDGTTALAGATVTAVGAPGTFTTTTAADGTYVMQVEGNVTYALEASAPSYATSASQNVPVAVTPLAGVNFTVRLITAITGIVKTAAGVPVPNAVIQVGDAGPAAVSDAAGHYTVKSIAPNSGVSFYADALGYADQAETIDASAAADAVLTKDVVLTPKAETDYTYIQNGGFESGALAPWALNYGSPIVGVTSAVQASGNYSGYWQSTVAAWYEGYLSQTVPVIAGSTYNIYFKLKTAAAVGQCGFSFLNANGDELAWWGYDGGLRLGENWMYTTVPNTWEQALNFRSWDAGVHLAAARVTPPDGTVSIRLIMGLGASAVGQVLYVDDVVVDRVGPAAPPLTPRIAMPAGVPTFTFPTLDNHSYRLVYKNTLADPAWQSIAGGAWTLGTGAEMTLTDPSSPLPAARFYQLQLQ